MVIVYLMYLPYDDFFILYRQPVSTFSIELLPGSSGDSALFSPEQQQTPRYMITDNRLPEINYKRDY
jgi:hypothetical protein